MILFDSDSDNSFVYQDISLLFYNVIILVAGAAMISRQITMRTFLYPRPTKLEGGVYWIHLVRLSVCPSVRL